MHCTTLVLFSISELRTLSEKQKVPVDLDTYIKKLANSRKRIMLVNDILQNVQVLIWALDDHIDSTILCVNMHIVTMLILSFMR